MFLNPALDTNNPFLGDVEQKLYEYFCKGVILAEGKNLALGGAMLFLMSPFRVFIVVLFDFHKVLFLLVIWWFSIDYLVPYRHASDALIYFGLLGLFWKSILNEILNMLKGILIFTTWGGVLRLLCKACLNNNFFGQAILIKGKNEEIINTFVAVLGGGFRKQYDQLVDLYLNSNTDWGQSALRDFLEKEKLREN